jgi:hypothetical protein
MDDKMLIKEVIDEGGDEERMSRNGLASRLQVAGRHKQWEASDRLKGENGKYHTIFFVTCFRSFGPRIEPLSTDRFSALVPPTSFSIAPNN